MSHACDARSGQGNQQPTLLLEKQPKDFSRLPSPECKIATTWLRVGYSVFLTSHTSAKIRCYYALYPQVINALPCHETESYKGWANYCDGCHICQDLPCREVATSCTNNPTQWCGWKDEPWLCRVPSHWGYESNASPTVESKEIRTCDQTGATNFVEELLKRGQITRGYMQSTNLVVIYICQVKGLTLSFYSLDSN